MNFLQATPAYPSPLTGERSGNEDKEIATAGLQAFFKITELWGLSANDQRVIIGSPPSSTFFKWKSNKTANRLDSGTLERISYILGMHKALMILLPSEESAYSWIKKPNDAPLFKGKTALSLLLGGLVSDLYEVRKYLDGERG